MATHSYIAAALSKYDTLTAALFPGAARSPVAFDQQPQAAATGQRRPPYVVLKDKGAAPTFQSDYGGVEVGEFDFEVYADTLADVDTIVAAIRWNGSAPSAKAGFDHGTLTVAAPRVFLSVVPTREARSLDGTGAAAQRVHKCVLSYRVEQEIDPDLSPA